MAVRRPITLVTEFGTILIHIIGIARPVVRQVSMMASLDGELTVDLAEELGLEISEGMGPMEVRIKGFDVLDNPSQELLARGIARLTFRIIQAIRAGRTP